MLSYIYVQMPCHTNFWTLLKYSVSSFVHKNSSENEKLFFPMENKRMISVQKKITKNPFTFGLNYFFFAILERCIEIWLFIKIVALNLKIKKKVAFKNSIYKNTFTRGVANWKTALNFAVLQLKIWQLKSCRSALILGCASSYLSQRSWNTDTAKCKSLIRF